MYLLIDAAFSLYKISYLLIFTINQILNIKISTAMAVQNSKEKKIPWFDITN